MSFKRDLVQAKKINNVDHCVEFGDDYLFYFDVAVAVVS